MLVPKKDGRKKKLRKKLGISKDLKIFLVLSMIFLSSLTFLSLFLFDFTFKIESESISINVPTQDGYYEEYSKEIEIIRPKGTLEQQLPLIILLNGKFLNSRSMNLIQKEFLANNYAVVLSNLEIFDSRIFEELEILLQKLEDCPYIDSTRIGLIGHSYGAHFAFQFGMSTIQIQGVICGNPGSYELFTNNDYGTPQSNLPRNLLLIMNENSSYHNQPPEEYLKYASSGFATEINLLYGNFEDGSAREAYVSNSFFGHASSLYDPNAIKKEIQWMNQSLGIEGEGSSHFNLFVQVISLFLLFSLLSVSGFGMVAKFTVQMPKISEYFNRFKLSNQNIKKKKDFPKKINPQYDPKKDAVISSEEINEKSEKKSRSTPISTNLNILSNKNKDLIGKYSRYLFVSTFIVILFQYFYYNLIFWTPSLQDKDISDLIVKIFDFFGIIFENFDILIDSTFPFEFMYLWVVFFLVIKITLFKDLTSSKLISYSLKQHLFSLMKGSTMFVFLWLMLRFVSFFIVGYKIPKIYILNLILVFFIIHCINFSSFLFLEKLGDNSNAIIKIVLFILFNYACLLLPVILFKGFGNFFQDYIVFFILALLNPSMYKKKIGILTISWFNYFFILFAAIWTF